MNIQRNNLNYSRTPTEKKHLSSLQHPQVTQMQSYDSCPWPRPSETKGREGGYWCGGGANNQETFFQGYCCQAKQPGAQRDREKNWRHCNPERKGWWGGVHAIPREKGAERRSAEEETKYPHASFRRTKTTTNPRVCLYLGVPDGVPGAGTVQPTNTVDSG